MFPLSRFPKIDPICDRKPANRLIFNRLRRHFGEGLSWPVYGDKNLQTGFPLPSVTYSEIDPPAVHPRAMLCMEVRVATQRQIESARINGAKSRGPKTPEGKCRSSLNARKHGLTSGIMAPGPESVAALEQLFAEYTADFRPTSPAEAHLADQMAVAMFRLNQTWAAEVEIWSRALARYESFPMPERLALAFGAECTALMNIQRHESRFERQYELALSRILTSRKCSTASEKLILQNEPDSLRHLPPPHRPPPSPRYHGP
jgi:hypothetical protein